jgi:hypothetical protein
MSEQTHLRTDVEALHTLAEVCSMLRLAEQVKDPERWLRRRLPTAGAKVTLLHSRHSHVVCPPWQPPAHGMCPTSIRPGPSRWPLVI